MKANNNLTKVTSHYKSWVRSWSIVNNYGIISKVIQVLDKWQLFCCFKHIVKITLTWIWIVNFELYYLRLFIWQKCVSLLDLGYIYHLLRMCKCVVNLNASFVPNGKDTGFLFTLVPKCLMKVKVSATYQPLIKNNAEE